LVWGKEKNALGGSSRKGRVNELIAYWEGNPIPERAQWKNKQIKKRGGSGGGLEEGGDQKSLRAKPRRRVRLKKRESLPGAKRISLHNKKDRDRGSSYRLMPSRKG